MMTDESNNLTCPQCGEPASGNFCQHCGTDLGGRFCNQCGSKVRAGAKFCSECGAQVGGGGPPSTVGAAPARGAADARARAARSRVSRERKDAAAEVVSGQNLPWWIAGAAMFALILVVGLSMVRPGPGPVPTAGSSSGAAPAGGGALPDISQMSPIEAADRLFNRVMTSVSVGDSAAAQQFLPMAIAAYNRARPLNLDGLFHLSMLNRTAGNLEAALDNALEIVEEDPNHLLGLAAAAEAAVELGELDEAEAHYRRIVEIYDDESQRSLEEYGMHSQIMTVLKEEAEQFLAGR
jgi:tetratricopeptide (TPR) repeat protein